MKRIVMAMLAVVIVASILVSVVMIRRQVERSQAPVSQPITISNGDYTWQLGGVVVDGTNIPLDQVQIEATAVETP